MILTSKCSSDDTHRCKALPCLSFALGSSPCRQAPPATRRPWCTLPKRASSLLLPCIHASAKRPPCGVREKALVHRSEADAAKTQPDAIARLVRLVALSSVHRMPANVRAHKAFVLCWLRLRPWRWMCSRLAAANTSSRGCATSPPSVSGGKECEQQHRRRGEKETGQMRRASDNQRQACVPRGRGQSPVRLQDTASGQRNSSAETADLCRAATWRGYGWNGR